MGRAHGGTRLQDFSTSYPEEITIVISSLSGGSLKQKLTFDSSTHRTVLTLAQFARCVRAFIPLTFITLRLIRGVYYSRINCSYSLKIYDKLDSGKEKIRKKKNERKNKVSLFGIRSKKFESKIRRANTRWRNRGMTVKPEENLQVLTKIKGNKVVVTEKKDGANREGKE